MRRMLREADTQMTRSRGTLSPEVRALLDEERAIPAQPAAVRARAMARARAALVAGAAATAASPPPRGAAGRAGRPRPRWSAWPARRWSSRPTEFTRMSRASQLPSRRAPAAAPAPIAVAESARRAAGHRAAPIDEVPPARAARCFRRRGCRRPTPLRAELHLLRLARAAVAREDFAAALPPIAEHARRFKDGRLAEEREALRVKALVGPRPHRRRAARRRRVSHALPAQRALARGRSDVGCRAVVMRRRAGCVPARSRSWCSPGAVERSTRAATCRTASCPSTSATRSSSTTTAGATTGAASTRRCSRTTAARRWWESSRSARSSGRIAKANATGWNNLVQRRALERPREHPRRHHEHGHAAGQTRRRPDRFDDTEPFGGRAADRRSLAPAQHCHRARSSWSSTRR